MSKDVRMRVGAIVDEYMAEGDIAHENANTSVSPSGLLMAVGGEGLKKHNLAMLKEEGFEELVDLHNKGGVHIHDLSLGAYVAYCAGSSLSNLLNDGLNSSIQSAPAKHFASVVNHIVNYFGSMANDFAGAQAFNDVDMYLAPYAYKLYLDYKKEGCSKNIAFKLARREIYQNIQSLVFHLNYKSRWGSQSPFTNFTLAFTVPDDMKDQLALIGGKPIDTLYDYAVDGIKVNNHTYGDLVDWQRLVTEAFLDVLLAGDAEGKSFTFPVLTINVTDDFFGHPAAPKVYELTARYGYPFFQNFINGKSGGKKISPEDTRSMCPLHPETKIIVKPTKQEKIAVRSIGEVYNNVNLDKTNYQVLHNGEWLDCKPIQVETKDAIKVKTSSGITVRMDKRHIQPIKTAKGCSIRDITGGEIETGMYVPFNSEGVRESYNNYMAGKFLGAYVGDGSLHGGTVVFRLNNSKKMSLLYELKDYAEQMGYLTGIREGNRNVMFLDVKSHEKSASTWIKQFICDGTALHKKLNNRVFNMGRDFAQGVLDGWYETDGGNSGRIYTASEGLVEGFTHICGYLGQHYNVCLEPDTRDGRYGENPVYTLKFHKNDNYGSVYFKEDGYYWYKVIEVKKDEAPSRCYYCLEVDSDDHYFQLANGFVTHNCRLSLSIKDVAKHTGGLFGGADNTGSIQVITLCLPYLAMEVKKNGGGIPEFFERVYEIMDISKEEQLWKRKLVDQKFESGFFELAKQNFRRGFNTFFSTIGFIGLWECVQILLENDESFLTDDGMRLAESILEGMRGRCNQYMEETGKLFNTEATPSEGATYKLAKKALKQFPDMPVRGSKVAPYFTNSCHIPVEYQDQLDLVFKTQDKLQQIPSGGTVTHFTTGEQMTAKDVEEFIKLACQTTIPYFSINTVFSVCPICGYVSGYNETCPHEHTVEQIEALRKTRPEMIIE